MELDRRAFMKLAASTVVVTPLLAAACGGGSGGSSSEPGSTAAAPADTGAAPSTTTAATTSDALATRHGFLNSTYTLQDDFWAGWSRGCQEACDVLNFEYNENIYNFDTNVLRGAIENAQLNGINGTLMIVTDAAASPTILGLCQQNEIYAVNNYSNAPWNTPLDIGDYFVAYHTANLTAVHQAMCEMMFEELGGTGKFVHITGVPGNGGSDAGQLGVDRALANYPGIEMVARAAGEFARGPSQEAMEGIIAANPQIDAVMAASDDSGVGVVTALKAANIDALVAGTDAISEFLDLIIEGSAFATAADHGGWLGGWSTVRVFDAINGATLNPAERMMFQGAFAIDTPEAAEAYDQIMYKEPKFPFDWTLMSRVLHPDDWDPQMELVPINPEEYWADRPKPAGYELPEAYVGQAGTDQRAEVTTLYAEHLALDPFSEVKTLTRGGGTPLI